MKGTAKPSVGRAALLIPLTGPAAGLGQIMREAASLGGTGVGLSAEVEILDSGPDAGTALKAAQAAVEGGARMIVGPLFSAQARAVGQALGAKVPVIALSNDSELAAAGVFVFGVTPVQSAQAVLGFAAGRGKRRIAIVVPPGEFGKRSVAAATAVSRQLRVALAAPLVRTSGAGLTDALRAAGGGSLPQAVYLPDAGPELAEFAGALSGSGVQILGSAQWSGIDPGAIRGLEGAWFSAPDPVRFRPFALALKDRIDTDAGILAGLAFDGVEMARLLGRIGEQTRKGVLREKGFIGVLGAYRFASTGMVQRGLAVLEVGESGITLVGATAA